jgi:hypothetical protein
MVVLWRAQRHAEAARGWWCSGKLRGMQKLREGGGAPVSSISVFVEVYLQCCGV